MVFKDQVYEMKIITATSMLATVHVGDILSVGKNRSPTMLVQHSQKGTNINDVTNMFRLSSSYSNRDNVVRFVVRFFKGFVLSKMESIHWDINIDLDVLRKIQK